MNCIIIDLSKFTADFPITIIKDNKIVQMTSTSLNDLTMVVCGLSLQYSINSIKIKGNKSFLEGIIEKEKETNFSLNELDIEII